jgi:hypothetical protein
MYALLLSIKSIFVPFGVMLVFVCTLYLKRKAD